MSETKLRGVKGLLESCTSKLNTDHCETNLVLNLPKFTNKSMNFVTLSSKIYLIEKDCVSATYGLFSVLMLGSISSLINPVCQNYLCKITSSHKFCKNLLNFHCLYFDSHELCYFITENLQIQGQSSVKLGQSTM